jgi:hypothetical protein
MHDVDAAVMDAQPTPPLGTAVVPETQTPSVTAVVPPAAAATPTPPLSSVTPAMLLDLRLAAREIRGLLASRPVGLSEANQLRALADRLETHAQLLEGQLSR